MSTGYMIKRKVCNIGKKSDKSDCKKKDCNNCRHWIEKEVWQDCLSCNKQCLDCPQITKYKCIKGFCVEETDDADGEFSIILEGTIWNISEDRDFRVVGGEIRLEYNSGTWLEISMETLKQYFIPIE